MREPLEPLPPDERPPIVLVCVALCLAIAVGNLVLWAAGWEVRGQDLDATAAIVPALLFGWIAYGLWRTRLLAVAAMQVMLAVTALFASGGLLVASDLPSALLCATIILVSGALFWPLIRVNGRIGARDRVDSHG